MSHEPCECAACAVRERYLAALADHVATEMAAEGFGAEIGR